MVYLNEFKYTKLTSLFILKIVLALKHFKKIRKINNYTILDYTIIIHIFYVSVLL